MANKRNLLFSSIQNQYTNNDCNKCNKDQPKSSIPISWQFVLIPFCLLLTALASANLVSVPTPGTTRLRNKSVEQERMAVATTANTIPIYRSQGNALLTIKT